MKTELLEQITSLKQQGYTHAQIAKTLNISKSTVSRYLKKANETETETKPKIETRETETNETIESDTEAIETSKTKTPETSKTDLKEFLEDKNSNLKIVTPQQVAEDLNSRITLVPEVEPKEEPENKNPVSKVKEKITANKYLIAIVIITVIGAAIGLYTLFRHRKSKTNSKHDKNTPAKEVVETEKGKPVKKSLEVKTPDGYVEEKLNAPSNVAIL